MSTGSSLLTAVVPALDEAPSIGAVVAGLRADALVATVVVVDNGSSDGTGEVARSAGARVVREERRGYGRACLAGVRAADGELILLLDGDGADDLADLPRLVAPLVAGEADLVVGARAAAGRARGAIPPHQAAGNRVAAALVRLLYGVRVSDLGPLRVIRRRDLLALEMRETTYGWSTEMLVKAVRAGYRYREVPVRYRRRTGASKVGGTVRGSLRAGGCILATVVRYRRWRPAGIPVPVPAR